MLARTLRKFHKITALFVGIQIFLWMLSGLYMTAVPIDIVRGIHLAERPEQPIISHSNLQPLPELLGQYNDVSSVELKTLRNQLVYIVKTNHNKHVLHAQTGEKLKPLTQAQASDIAKTLYTGNGEITLIEWIDKSNNLAEIGSRALPLWRVTFDDYFAPTLYISAITGELATVRSDIWRLFDFFWMLHIMDYDEREDFNNPLVILMASIGLLLSLTGLQMLLHALRKQGLMAMFK